METSGTLRAMRILGNMKMVFQQIRLFMFPLLLLSIRGDIQGVESAGGCGSSAYTSDCPAMCAEGRIIIIGAGLAGLGAADALRQHGCDVTVFEATSRRGGEIRNLPSFA
eukprot:1202941-Pyramimonas_sp.AAC.2